MQEMRIAILCSILLAPLSAAATPGVTVGLKPLLGSGASTNLGIVVATVCARDAVDGTLELELGWRIGVEVHRQPLHVPAGACVRQTAEVPLHYSMLAQVRDADGVTLAHTTDSITSYPSYRSGVVLDPRLKGILATGGFASFTTIEPGLEVPASALGWSSVSVVVTGDRTLSDQPPSVRSAVEQWIERGGTLVVASDQPHEVERRGAGRVVTTTIDEHLQDRLHSLVYEEGGHPRRTLIEPGGDLDGDLMRWQSMRETRDTTDSVDPLSRHPPSSGLSWALLLGYVALVGPLSYRTLARRGHPLLAIGAIPFSAACVSAALVTHTLADRGLAPRYDAEVRVQTRSGSSHAAVHRFAGLVTTRPGRMHIEGSPGAYVTIVPFGGRRMPTTTTFTTDRDGARRPSVDTGAVGLWDTVFVTEGALIDLGGSIDITAAPDGYRVENRTRFAIHDAFLTCVDDQSIAHDSSLGTLAPGEVRDVRDVRKGVYPTVGRSQGPLERELTSTPGLLLTGKLDPGILPPYAGFARGHEETALMVLAE